jgi:hypothetical protein
MWGNKQGWVLSACLVLLVSWPLWLASQPPKVSAPSGAFPELLSHVALPQDPRTIVPAAMAEACDAGELYRQAIDEYDANTRQYDRYFRTPLTAQAEKPKAVDLLLQASRCSGMTLFSRTPSEVLNYNADTPAVEAIEKIGRMANQLGLLYRLDKKPDEARRHFEAMFALGYHLYAERLAWSEFAAGVNLMADAARGLAKVETDAGNTGRAASLEQFAKSADEYKLKQFEVYKVVSSIDSGLVGRHGGDVFALARSSPEPMWRGEAILALGRMKYNTPNRGDQLAAARELQEWSTDPHPAIRAAASAASGLTLAQYRTLR